jgi:aspartyl-tRNA(Asn)/glutamyl-tRNA(Gln) amidotransferase subunit A
MQKIPTTITETLELLQSGAITSVALTQLFLDTIREKDTKIHCYLEIYDTVLDQAQQADDRRAAGESAPLLGVPISIKDNIMMQGHTVSAASKILENYIAPYNAHIIDELQKAGAVIIGRTNMDEFAMGGSCENSAFGPTYNPLDLSRIPGGSSGGAAASVAAGLCVAAIGTDTGGSVRLPAAFCGLCGLYPTYGSTSRYGLIAMGSSLDQAGSVGVSVDDCALLHSVLSTYDVRDAQCVPITERKTISSQVKKIGIPRALLAMDGVSETVRQQFDLLLEKLVNKGYEIIDIELPHITAAVPTYYIIMPAEVSTNLSRIDGVRFGVRESGDSLMNMYVNSKTKGFGPETQRRLLLGAYVLSAGYYDAYYAKATQVRELICQEIVKTLETVDVILTPTATSGAPKIGEMADTVAMYMMDIFTIPANLSGVPALSVPFGVDTNNMPLGMHIMGPHWGEGKLFTLGRDIELLANI